MLKKISRTRFLLLVAALPLIVVGVDTAAVFAPASDDNIPHSLQLLALIQQEAPAAYIVPKTLRRNDISALRELEGGHWKNGLAAFRASDMDVAAEHFSALAGNEQLSAGDRAAAAFWAYRAYSKAGDDASAAVYLDMAANEVPGFYSIIAAHISGKGTMAAEYAAKPDTVSLYPMPKWTPASGYKVEPALLFAIMRQESEFNPGAQSPKGAVGVMQLMPATANAMAHNIRVSGSISEPSVSMALGQQYLQHLMEISGIKNNLVFLLAAYNAGPGMLDKWLHNISYKDDPLLFIESIPYNTTRDYVVNVIGNYWIYSELFGSGEHTSLNLISEGNWPLYMGSGKQLTAKN